VVAEFDGAVVSGAVPLIVAKGFAEMLDRIASKSATPARGAKQNQTLSLE
jgi:hypothetical protein